MGDNKSKHIGPLHLILTNEKGKMYNIAKDGELVLSKQTGYTFFVYIKEHQDELEPLNKKKEEIGSFYKGLYDRKPRAEWTKKDVETDEANQRKRDKNLAEIDRQIKDLNDKFSDVVYFWHLVGKSLTLTKTDYNKTFRRGYKTPFDLTLAEHVRGGGKVYLEAFHETEDPVLNASHGVFVSSYDTPEIIGVAWTDHDGAPITGLVKDGSYVFLHIYTRNLYGHEISVQLMDNDADNYVPLDEDDKLSAKNKEGLVLYETKAEVNLYEATKTDQQYGIKGNLVSTSEAKISIENVQKAIIRVRVDPLITKKTFLGKTDTSKWREEGGVNLEIYPLIKLLTHGGEYRIKENYLKVEYYYDKAPSYTIDTYRSVIKIDSVTTNIAEFHPCGYQTITLSDEREAVLFDQSETMFINTFEVIAGSDPKKITIQLDATASTNDCDGKGMLDNVKHTRNVLDVIAFPRQKKDEKPIIIVEDEEEDKVGKKKKKNKWEWETVSNTEIGSISSENKMTSLSNKRYSGITFKTDTKMTFQVNYVYNSTPMAILGIAGLPGILRYFWIGDTFKTDDYKLRVLSCRHIKHEITVKVYPDVKWTLQVVFKNKTTEIEVLSNLKKRYRNKIDTKRITSIGDRELELGVLAEYDGGETNLTYEMGKTIEEVLKPLKQIVDFVNNTVLGKNNGDGDYGTPTPEHQEAAEEASRRAEAQQRAKTQKEIDKENKDEEDRVKRLKKRKNNIETQRKLSQDPKLTEAQREKAKRNLQSEVARANKKDPSLMRRMVGIDIEWPEISLGFSWSRAAIDSPEFKNMAYSSATLLEGFIKADPLIKADIFLDFLALAQRAHPLVLAIIAGLDIGLSMFGDGSKIVAELRLELEIGGEISGDINMKTKENTFNKKDSEFAEISGSAALSVTIGIYLQCKTKAIGIFGRRTQGEMSAKGEISGEAKISATSTIGCDDTGFYFTPQWQFDGLYIKGKAEGKGQIQYGDLKGEKSLSFEVKYQAIDSQDPVEFGKLYFKNM